MIANRSSLGDWLHMMMREAADGQTSLDELAKILNLSPRTVERRLNQEGRGFREIAQRARFDHACDLLRAAISVSPRSPISSVMAIPPILRALSAG